MWISIFGNYILNFQRDLVKHGRNYYGGAGIGADGKIVIDFEKYYCEGGTYGEDMPTAIMVVSAGTEGIVVASDSQGTLGNCEKKIFCTKGPTWNLAYALSGAASNYKLGVDEFKDTYYRIAEELKQSSAASLSDYSNKFIHDVGESLKSHFENKNETLTIHFAGYFGDRASISKRTLRFKFGVWEIEASSDGLDPRAGRHCFIGSQAVMRLLCGGDSRFSKFSSAAKFKNLKGQENDKDGLSLQEAIEVARNYIDACKSDEGKKTDPDQCNFIGGFTAIAKVTRSGGFAWVSKPVGFS